MSVHSNLQKLIELFKSGRYQCDTWFYQNIILLVKQLEVFQFLPVLQSNLSHVKKIHQLIQENSDSLNDQFDQNQAMQKAEQIKKQIHLIKTSEVSQIMQHLEKQQYTSYVHHAISLAKKYNYHSKYLEILRNILNTVYDPELRVQYVMICTLFMLRNQEKVQQVLSIYEKCIENGLQLMKNFRKNLPNLKKLIEIISFKIQEIQNQKDSEQRLQQNRQKTKQALQNIRVYCYGTYYIYTTLQKLCDIVKILQQKTKFTLKLSSYKSQIEQILSKINQCMIGQSQNHHLVQQKMSYFPIKELKTMFLGQKSGANQIKKTCKLCLRSICTDETEGENFQIHKICQQVIKELITCKAQEK